MNRRSITACALALGLLAVSGRVALAQDHGQNNEQNKNKDSHGQSNAQSDQQHQSKQQQQARIRDEDRRATEEWYRQHHQRAPAGWRDQDRLNPSMQGRLRQGRPLDRDLASRMHSLPSDLSRRYGPPPRGWRYGVIGGNVVLLDTRYVVQDVFTITFQIH